MNKKLNTLSGENGLFLVNSLIYVVSTRSVATLYIIKLNKDYEKL
jgi:hypothetical protein